MGGGGISLSLNVIFKTKKITFYFAKSGLKQAVRNKPTGFGFKAGCLCSESVYVETM